MSEDADRGVFGRSRAGADRFSRHVCVWWLVPARLVGLAVSFFGYRIALVGTVDSTGVVGAVREVGLFLFLGGALLVVVGSLAPLAVFFERRRLPESGEWHPSSWYYFTLDPQIVGLLFSSVYTYRRLRHVGPWAARADGSVDESFSGSAWMTLVILVAAAAIPYAYLRLP